MKPVLFACFLLIILTACTSQPKVKPETTLNIFSDTVVQNIHDLKDRRESAGLEAYLSHEKLTYRVQAAMSLASVGDSTTQGALIAAFKTDSSAEFRSNVALALAQCPKSLPTSTLVELYALSRHPKVIATLLWAAGKHAEPSIDSVLFDALANHRSPEIERGAMAGFYELMTRGYHSNRIIEKALELAGEGHEVDVREHAAAYLSRLYRTPDLDLTQHKATLYLLIEKEAEPLVKMHLVSALRLVHDGSVHQFIRGELMEPQDYRVMTHLIRVCDVDESALYYPLIIEQLKGKNEHVQLAAANYLKRSISAKSLETLIAMGDSCTFWQAKCELASGVFEKGTSEDLNTLFNQDWYNNELLHSPNDHARASTYSLFSSQPAHYPLLNQLRRDETSTMAKTYALEALGNMALQSSPEIKNKIENELIEAALSKDGFESYTASHLLLNQGFDLKGQKQLLDLIKQAATHWELPQYFEVRLELEKLSMKIEGTDFENHQLKNPYNHPINWDLVRSIPKEQLMIFHCAKGDIVVQLFIEEAPGTVSYLVELAREGFYDGLDFHRVVPNFVVQGGDPEGNGTGSSPFSLRSEFGWLNYTEGTVGIASAGKDTESCQFFITHNATPHLNGRYTIIGKVIEGMDVVHRIQMGDLIDKVEVPITLQ